MQSLNSLNSANLEANFIVFAVIGLCLLAIPVVVFFLFLSMMKDVKRMRQIFEDWNEGGMPPVISETVMDEISLEPPENKS